MEDNYDNSQEEGEVGGYKTRKIGVLKCGLIVWKIISDERFIVTDLGENNPHFMSEEHVKNLYEMVEENV